ncbi:MAG TPA: hypothetical protein PK156_02335 [Polyangium sp.]|nr:hypothetical protein [Polyangium sp.]
MRACRKVLTQGQTQIEAYAIASTDAPRDRFAALPERTRKNFPDGQRKHRPHGERKQPDASSLNYFVFKANLTFVKTNPPIDGSGTLVRCVGNARDIDTGGTSTKKA